MLPEYWSDGPPDYRLVSPDGTCGDLAAAVRDRCQIEGDALAKAIIQGFPIPVKEEEIAKTTIEEADGAEKSNEPVTPQLTVSRAVAKAPPTTRKRTKTPTRKKDVRVETEAAAEGNEKEVEETPAPKRKRAPRKPSKQKKCEAVKPMRESPVVAISKQLQGESRPKEAKNRTLLPSTVRAVRDSMVTQRIGTAMETVKHRNDAFWDYLKQILSHRDEAIRRDLYGVHAAIALLRKDLKLEQYGVSSEETPVTPDRLAEDFAREAQTRLDQCAKELERLKRHLPSKKPPTKMDAASQKPSDAEEEEERNKSEEEELSSEEVEEDGQAVATGSIDAALDVRGVSLRGERLSAMQIARRATMRMQALFAAAAAVNDHAQAPTPTSDDSPDSVKMKTPRQLHS